MRKYIKNKLSVIIPTYNEDKNITSLITEIVNHIKDKDYEILIVDDGSTDSTVDNIFMHFKENKNIKVLQREYDWGLLQSIKFALQSMTGEYFVVMDGDGQHSPKDIKPLIQHLDNHDLVIGVRDLKNLDAISPKRIFLSKLFIKIIKIILSVKISDPLTGFFAGKISLLNTKFFLLANSGFKVLLDLIFSNKKNNIKIFEKEIAFNTRDHGVSKLNLQVAFSFFTQLISYIFNGLISSKFIGFVIIGGFGFFIHFPILITLYNILEFSFYTSHIVATLLTATVNFLANNYLNFYNSKINSVNELTSAVIKYYIINLPGLITNVGVASFTYNVLTENFIFASFAGIIVDTIFKYVVSKTWIWRSN